MNAQLQIRDTDSMVGQRFGHLVVQCRNLQTGKSNSADWWCACDCGVRASKPGHKLRGGNVKRCGRSCPLPAPTVVAKLKRTEEKKAEAVKRGSRGLYTEADFTAEDHAIRIALTDPSPKIPPRLDVERNRERYVRLKLTKPNLALFPRYTCAECPETPTCRKAFLADAIDGACPEVGR